MADRWGPDDRRRRSDEDGDVPEWLAPRPAAPDPRYVEPQYGDQGYDPRYVEPQYGEQGYDPRYVEPQYGEQQYQDPRYVDEPPRADRTDPGRGASCGREPSDAGPGWGAGRGAGGTPTFPALPTLGIVAVLLLLAFFIGRATGGGGDEVSASGDGTTATSVQATTTLEPMTHVVTANESLSAIANQYGVSTADLASYNGITDVNELFIGQTLKIPPAGSTIATTSTTSKKK